MSTKLQPKTIDEATPDELRSFASMLGIPTDGVSDKEVMAKVRASIEGTTIYVTEASEEDDAAQTGSPPPKVAGTTEVASGGLVGSLGRDDPRVTITIHAEERDGVIDTRHKAVGVNGVVWLLKRGESIEIPYRVYEALNNAERDNITHSQDGTPIYQKAKNTPFNVEKMPSDAEIDAWLNRVGQVALP